MPNGHGGVPRFGSPVILLLLLGWDLARRPTFGFAWAWMLPYALAALLGWRLAWHIHMWDATEYGGAMTSTDKMSAAERRYLLGTLLYAPAAVGLVYLWLNR